MEILIIEGDTLGQRHRNYNNFLSNAINNKLYDKVPDINYEESDLDNLFKIDIAAHNRDVHYILKILKCEDMLYISRAIKRSTWIITDPQYAHIVNPNYLFNELFPQMTSKAIKKFILHVRLNLKEESRVEDFFNYYKQQDFDTALKWLPNCSIKFIEDVVEKNADKISNQVIARLCEKSISFLNIYLQKREIYYVHEFFNLTRYLINSNSESYMACIEDTLRSNNSLYFTKKFTKIIMKKFHDRILQNFQLYSLSLDKPTFFNYIKPEALKEFLLREIKDKDSIIHDFDYLLQIMNRLPSEVRYEFVKKVFIDKKFTQNSIEDIVQDSEFDNNQPICVSRSMRRKMYAHVPFSIALDHMKKHICMESKPKERVAMFETLLLSAKGNYNDISTLLKYYRENHINEPFKYRIKFVDFTLSMTKPHKFDKVGWEYLNDLFISMDVYTETSQEEYSKQTYIQCIILHNVIHNEIVPDIIEKKFMFDTCKKYNKILSHEENNKIFSYLFGYLTSKMNEHILDLDMFVKNIHLLENTLCLLINWDRELEDFPQIIEKMKQIIQLKREKLWNYNIDKLYNIRKSWRKFIFKESIFLHPNQDTLINALKYGPELLESYKLEVEGMCLNDKVRVDQFLKKIRVYWPSITDVYKTLFLNNITQKSNLKSSVIGLCYLLSRNDFLSLVNKYIPQKANIDWKQHDGPELSIQKYVAGNLHLARPQPSLSIALQYAERDYIQFIMPSLNAIFNNMSRSYACDNFECLKQLLDAPKVCLQKQGLRISSMKLKRATLVQLYSDIWKRNKSTTIRSIVFCETFNILCKCQDEVHIKMIWELLSTFIDNLTSEEQYAVYDKLSKVEKVPESVRGEFWRKSNKFLSALPVNENIKNLMEELRKVLPEVIEFWEDDYVIEMLTKSLDKRLSTGCYDSFDILIRFLWLSKAEDVLERRYNKVMVPMLECAFASWNTKYQGAYYVKSNLHEMCENLCRKLDTELWTYNDDERIATFIFTETIKQLENNLPKPENYGLVLKLKLAFCFFKNLITKKDILNQIKQSMLEHPLKRQPLNEKAASDIGRECVEYLKQDIKCIPTAYIIFGRVLQEMLCTFLFWPTSVQFLQKAIYNVNDFQEGHLLILELMKLRHFHQDDLKFKKNLLMQIEKSASKEVKLHLWSFKDFMLLR